MPYEPTFIASPCEFKVDVLDLELTDKFNVEHINAKTGKTKIDVNPSSDKQVVKTENQQSNSTVALSDKDSSPEQIFEMLREFIVNEYGYSEDTITHESKLQENLALDSLKSMEVVFEAMGNLGVRVDASHLGDISLFEIAKLSL